MENGRLKILSDLIPTGDIEKDKQIIPRIIDVTKPIHDKNVKDMDKLFEYYYNKTNIQSKNPTQRSDINNKIPINYPEITVTTINAYCFANDFTFSSRNSETQEKVRELNNSLVFDNYFKKSFDMYQNSAISGLGYRYIVPATDEQIEDGIYFETYCDLDPRQTYCVYTNDLKKEKICAIHFYDKKFYDDDYKQIRNVTVYDVWTKYHQWQFYRTSGRWTNSLFYNLQLDGSSIEYEAYPLTYGKIPIIENVRKADRTGDFELALDLMDAINALASARLDAVEQSVDYVILLRDIDTESEGALAAVKNAISDGILSFKSIPNATVQPEISVLNISLNQAEVQTLQDFLCEKLEEVLNIPNRETRSSGGDTGSAVESRNGFRSLENIAGLVTSNAMKTENETLDVILSICKNIPSCPFRDLSIKDVEIKDNRNKVENLTNASNAYATLRAAGMNDTDALITTRIVSDPQSVAKKNKEEKEDETEASNTQMTISNSQNNIGSSSGNTDE